MQGTGSPEIDLHIGGDISKETGEVHFKFTCDMTATVRKVKENGDESLTLGDFWKCIMGERFMQYIIKDNHAVMIRQKERNLR
ncbi:MAG: hypothetical protein K5760_02315 [Clostridium sp.]|nr:hypothetical protein [Clostridium sp.]